MGTLGSLCRVALTALGQQRDIAPDRNMSSPLVLSQIKGKGFDNKRMEEAPLSDHSLTGFSSMSGFKAT